jgi:mycothiol synthase
VTTTAPVRRTAHLSPDEVAEVLELARLASDADGVYPLSEHVVLHVRRGGDEPAIHLYVRDGDGLVGYAHVDTTDVVEGASAELVVHPMYRRRGLGRALVVAATEAATEHDPAGRLRLWAHGDHPSATALALSLGFRRTRVLYQMRRSLFAPIDPPELPDGVALRAFVPGEDDEAWVALNARAFAHLPDQGRWTLKDLRVRMAEPWFDPAGFLLAFREQEHDHSLLAERDGESAEGRPTAGGRELVGFHWTKVHGDRGHDHDPMGEVYVLGVDPAAHGLGLGRALTLAGLRYLRSRGLAQAMLYVDEANTPAVALYGKLGFARWSTDVSFQRG